jgi:hypothetical protein
MILDINRKLETSFVISENGTKTVKKAHLEIVTGYNSKDGTEATKDEKPAFKIDRHLVEQTATLSDKTEETLMERKETFTFLASGDFSHKSPVLFPKSPQKLKVDLSLVIEEPTEETRYAPLLGPDGVCFVEEIFEMEQITTEK